MKETDCPKCHKVCLLPVEIPCNHIMCFLCVKALILLNEKNCPKCNERIPSDYLHKIVLVNYEILYETSDSSCWQYKGRKGWWMYDERSNAIIEREFNKTARFELTIGAYAYYIDFNQMIQIRCDHSELGRQIRRDSQRKNDVLGVAGVHFPNISKRKDLIAYVKDEIKIQPSIQQSEDSDTAFWLYQQDDKWLKFNIDHTKILEYYYKSFLDDDASNIFEIKLKNEDYEVDFKNWTMKTIRKNEIKKIMRKTDGALPDVVSEETFLKLKTENVPSEKNDLPDISKLKIQEISENEIDVTPKNANEKEQLNENDGFERTNKNEDDTVHAVNTSKIDQEVNGEVCNDKNDFEEKIVISNARWFFKNENNIWIGISEKGTKYIEKVYIDYLMNQNNKFEMTDDGQSYIIDFKSHVKYKKGMEQEQQVLQRAADTNEAESKFTKVIIDRKLADRNMIKSESWYVHDKNEWQKYDQEVCSLLDEAYLTFLKTSESNYISKEIDGRQCVFDFAQFIVLDYSNMNMTRFKRGNKSN